MHLVRDRLRRRCSDGHLHRPPQQSAHRNDSCADRRADGPSRPHPLRQQDRRCDPERDRSAHSAHRALPREQCPDRCASLVDRKSEESGGPRRQQQSAHWFPSGDHVTLGIARALAFEQPVQRRDSSGARQSVEPQLARPVVQPLHRIDPRRTRLADEPADAVAGRQ